MGTTLQTRPPEQPTRHDTTTRQRSKRWLLLGALVVGATVGMLVGWIISDQPAPVEVEQGALEAGHGARPSAPLRPPPRTDPTPTYNIHPSDEKLHAIAGFGTAVAPAIDPADEKLHAIATFGRGVNQPQEAADEKFYDLAASRGEPTATSTTPQDRARRAQADRLTGQAEAYLERADDAAAENASRTRIRSVR